mmetsp:Transcript_27006/g.45376  ORF Transcript_27006/g.45376 Transcript_27006/m.45376 type:complete len:194 (+) Transcript_27006:1244-1825(+)
MDMKKIAFASELPPPPETEAVRDLWRAGIITCINAIEAAMISDVRNGIPLRLSPEQQARKWMFLVVRRISSETSLQIRLSTRFSSCVLTTFTPITVFCSARRFIDACVQSSLISGPPAVALKTFSSRSITNNFAASDALGDDDEEEAEDEAFRLRFFSNRKRIHSNQNTKMLRRNAVMTSIEVMHVLSLFFAT